MIVYILQISQPEHPTIFEAKGVYLTEISAHVALVKAGDRWELINNMEREIDGVKARFLAFRLNLGPYVFSQNYSYAEIVPFTIQEHP